MPKKCLQKIGASRRLRRSGCYQRKIWIKIEGVSKGFFYENILRFEDVFVCAPTGSVKTYCFAFLSGEFNLRNDKHCRRSSLPALGQQGETSKSSVTLVVSPLSSLVAEQAGHLQELGMNTAFVGEC